MTIEGDYVVIPTGMADCYVKVLTKTSNKLILKDSDKGMSITNAAEHVVKYFHNRYPEVRIFYYDSMGSFDELVKNEDGEFHGFAFAEITEDPNVSGVWE